MRRAQAIIFTFLALIIGSTMFGLAQEASNVGCGGREVEIADLQWPSATILAHIHAQILTDELGCTTKIVVSDLAAVATTLKAAQKPSFVPEMWPTRVAEKWNQAIEARSAFLGGESFDDSGLEGWYVPQKLLTDFPALKNVSEIGTMGERYQLNAKPKFISCPPKWACAQINKRMLRAYGLADKFDIIEPENRISMDQLIGQLASANTPFVFYYWQPNALIAQLDVRPLDLGAFDGETYTCFAKADCVAAKTSSFPNEQIHSVLAEWVRGDAPELVPYARKAQMPLAVMNELMAKMVDDGESAQAVAQYFIQAHEAIWQDWLPQISQ